MTLVIYRDCRIEIEKTGKSVNYSIWDDQFLVAFDSVSLPVKAVKADCQSLVDDYLKNPGNFR